MNELDSINFNSNYNFFQIQDDLLPKSPTTIQYLSDEGGGPAQDAQSNTVTSTVKPTKKLSWQLRGKITLATKKAIQIHKGTSHGLQPLIEKSYCEVFDHKHRYVRELHPFFMAWKESSSTDNFETWLHKLDEKQDVPGKEALKKAKLLGKDGELLDKDGEPIPSMKYLNEKQRSEYEMQINEQGKIFTKQNGNKPLHSIDKTKDNAYIFVVAADEKIYIGPYKRGVFGHSCFLSGGAVKSAGALILEQGKLSDVWDHSGHYNGEFFKKGNPQGIKKVMVSALQALQKKGVDITDVNLLLTEITNDIISTSKTNASIFLKANK